MTSRPVQAPDAHSQRINAMLAAWLLAPVPDGLGMYPHKLVVMLLDKDPHASLRAYLAPILEANKYTAKAPSELWTLAQWDYNPKRDTNG